MNLESQLAALKNRSDLNLAERAQLSCRIAKQLEKAGEYEAAYDALSEFWPDPYSQPKLDSLDELSKAEILLRVGSLEGFQGSSEQTSGRQETAKDLITKSIEIFEEIAHSEKAAEAR